MLFATFGRTPFSYTVFLRFSYTVFLRCESGARRVNDEMLFAAANAVSNYVSDDELKEGIIFPRVSNIRDVSANVAAAVAVRLQLCFFGFKFGLF